jgi:predicted transposase YbfD/YdcC
MMTIDGAVVTIDAIGCQRDIAQKIIDRKADYILALKGNRGTLREDVQVFANEQRTRAFAHCKITTQQTVDADHGRIETRKYTVIHDIDWLQARHGWPGLNGLIMVESQRKNGVKVERETRFYITSTTLAATLAGPMIRALGRGKRPVLGHGHDLRRRRTNHPNRKRARKISQPSTQSPITCSERLRAKTPSPSDATPPPGIEDYLVSLIAA